MTNNNEIKKGIKFGSTIVDFPLWSIPGKVSATLPEDTDDYRTKTESKRSINSGKYSEILGSGKTSCFNAGYQCTINANYGLTTGQLNYVGGTGGSAFGRGVAAVGSNALATGQTSQASTEAVAGCLFIQGETEGAQQQNHWKGFAKASLIYKTLTLSEIEKAWLDKTNRNRPNVAFGEASFTGGTSNISLAKDTFTIGQFNLNYGIDSIVGGIENINYASRSLIQGYANYIGFLKPTEYSTWQKYKWDAIHDGSSREYGSQPYDDSEDAKPRIYCDSNQPASDYITCLGVDNKINGTYLTVLGNNNNIFATRCFILGNENTIANSDHYSCYIFGNYLQPVTRKQYLFGEYANVTANTKMAFGIGTSNEDKKNAFEILNDGRVKVFTEPKDDNDVVRLTELNSIQQNMSSLTNTVNNSALRITDLVDDVSNLNSTIKKVWGNNTKKLKLDVNVTVPDFSMSMGLNQPCILGTYSFIFGHQNKTNATAFSPYTYTFIVGRDHIAKASHQTIFGRYSQTTADTLFAVGNGTGTDDNDRFSPFEVLKNNKVKVRTAPTESDDVLRLGDLPQSIQVLDKLIPTNASEENQLADKAFVNSSIFSMSADYITYDSNGNPFPTKQALLNATAYYNNGSNIIPQNKDYCLVQNDEDNNGASVRYVCTGLNSNNKPNWALQYKVNDTPFTEQQISAINSGITKDIVDKTLVLPNTAPTKESIVVVGKDNKQTLIPVDNIQSNGGTQLYKHTYVSSWGTEMMIIISPSAVPHPYYYCGTKDEIDTTQESPWCAENEPFGAIIWEEPVDIISINAVYAGTSWWSVNWCAESIEVMKGAPMPYDEYVSRFGNDDGYWSKTRQGLGITKAGDMPLKYLLGEDLIIIPTVTKI